jgi:hypothetical protein
MFILPRSSDGTRPKLESETALLAFICLRLASVPERSQTRYLKQERRVNMSGAVARQVGAKRSWRHPGKRPTGPGRRKPKRSDQALRSWLLIDEPALGFRRALARFPGEGARQVDLIAALRRLGGVRQVFETRESRDVYAVVLFRPDDEERMVASLEGLGRCFWNGISYEDQTPAVETWAQFLKRQAREEDLRL